MGFSSRALSPTNKMRTKMREYVVEDAIFVPTRILTFLSNFKLLKWGFGVLGSLNQTINWYPDHVKNGRFGNWLEHNVDWALGQIGRAHV